jgi:plasmid stabilization system protein ParE
LTKPLRFEDEAHDELEGAVRRYEEKRPGLGAEFLAEVDLVLDRVIRLPASGARVPFLPREIGARRVPVIRFPYHVVYVETATDIRILAVAHDRRRPGYWTSRLRPVKR